MFLILVGLNFFGFSLHFDLHYTGVLMLSECSNRSVIWYIPEWLIYVVSCVGGYLDVCSVSLLILKPKLISAFSCSDLFSIPLVHMSWVSFYIRISYAKNFEIEFMNWLAPALLFM